LEAIAFGAHQEKVHPDVKDWSKSTKTEAQALLSGVTQFDFIASFAILYTLLSGMQGITQKLQTSGLDIYQVHQLVSCSLVKLL